MANYLAARLVVVLLSGLAGFGLGMVPAVFISHTRREWWTLLCGVPLALGGLLVYIHHANGPPFVDALFPTRAIAIQAMCQVLGVIAGLWAGRSVARGVLRVLLTRRLLQHITFLWRVDHLEPPRTA